MFGMCWVKLVNDSGQINGAETFSGGYVAIILF